MPREPRPPCDKCGKVHPRCSAHNRKGGPCGRPRQPDTAVCDLHGGTTKRAKTAAARVRIEREARAALAKAWAEQGDQPVVDPLAELARVAGEAVAFKDMLRAQVERLDGVLTYWQEQDIPTGEEGEVWTKAAEDARAVVVLYERAQARVGKILTDMVKLDIAGRMLELRTVQAVAIVEAVRQGLSTVDLSGEIRKAAENAIADALSKITEDNTPPRELELL